MSKRQTAIRMPGRIPWRCGWVPCFWLQAYWGYQTEFLLILP